jgi:uncharacterized protein (TIGR03118 family)
MRLYPRVALLIGCLAFAAAMAGQARAANTGYVQTDLVTDIPALAAQTGARLDPTLLNPWGVAFFPGASPFWINYNNAFISALVDGTGAAFALLPFVNIPLPSSLTEGAPSGIVANSTAFTASPAFDIVLGGANLGPALFIFDTEDGTISAWNLAVPDPDGLIFAFSDDAVLVKDNSQGGGPNGAVYKGLAFGTSSAGAPLLYATNFRSGKIEVFDSNFEEVTNLSGSFSDPKLQNGYAPFGIQNMNGELWVTYALQDDPKHDPVNKPGHGFVDVFDTDGNLLRRFAQHGHLDSPWGVVLALPSFGQFANDILIGNFGDGVINAYDPTSGHWLGVLSAPHGGPLVNDGLWALTFGGALNALPDALYFTAGLNHEADGLFGTIVPR